MKEKLYLQFIYDGNLVEFPWCAGDGYFCELEKFVEYAIERVDLNYEYIEKWCRGEERKNYINKKMPQREHKRKEPKATTPEQ